jgi:uncharacterized repeat protein (TIGR01451 family)
VVFGVVIASEDNTLVQVDTNADGVTDYTRTLNEGETFTAEDLCIGSNISANRPIQVSLLTGDICSSYESRWFTLAPDEDWSNTYFTPVSTNSLSPTYVWLHNPNNIALDIYYENDFHNSLDPFDIFTIPAGRTIAIEVPNNTGARFSSIDFNTLTGGLNFYAMATIDSNPTSGLPGQAGGSNSAHDWGFALLPRSQLSSQISMVGFAPGYDPTLDPNSFPVDQRNTSPVWITVDHLDVTNNNNIEVCVDYNGDGGSQLDIYGNQYDQSFVLRPLQQLKLRDSDFIPGDYDQTGMRVWVCDGSGALIAGAYGQEADATNTGRFITPGGAPAIDLGTGIPNGLPYEFSKCVELVRDLDQDGEIDVCDEINYSINIENVGLLPIDPNTFGIIDILPPELTYVENSSYWGTNVASVYFPDDATGTPFPFDEMAPVNQAILRDDRLVFSFNAVLESYPPGGLLNNCATMRMLA